MADLARLGIVVDASGAIRGVRDFGNATERTAKQATMLERGVRTLGLTIGAYQAIRAVRATIALGDAYTNMQSRLTLVTHGTANLAHVQAELYGIAQDTRSPLEATAILYERIARNARALGLAQYEVLGVTDSINKAMVISGVSTESARAAMVQLSQGFASGVLRGEELNSVLEQAPRLAQAIADGMGVTVGELRKLGLEGKLTSKAVVDALQAQAGAIDAEFGQMEVTVSGAMTRLRNAMLMYVGEKNKAAGATRTLAEAISGLANNIDNAVTVLQMAAGVLVARYAAGMLAANAASLQMRTQVLLGNAVMLDSVQAQRGAAAAAIDRGKAAVGASAVTVRQLQVEREAIRQLQIVERQRLAQNAARVRRGVPEAQLAPLGGAVQMRDNAQVAFAMKERAAAQESLNTLGVRATVVERDLTAAQMQNRTAANMKMGAIIRMTGVMAGSTIATRALTAVTTQLGAAMNLLGGPIGVAIIGAMALNAWLDKILAKRVAAAGNTPEEMAAFNAAMETGRKRRAAAEQQVTETAAEAKRRAEALREYTSAVVEANAQTATTIRTADQELALLQQTGVARELHAVVYEAENRLRAEDTRLRVALIEAQGKEGSARAVAIRLAHELHAINRENVDQWKKGQAALIVATDLQAKYNARLKAQVDASRAAMDAEVALEAERRKALEQPFLNAMENIQRGWGEMFERLFQMGRVTARDIGDLFMQTAAQMAAGVLAARTRTALAGAFGMGIGGGTQRVGETAGLAGLGGDINRDALSGAMGGGIVGYGIGRAGGGAVGGAMGGAAAGFALGGPVGAAAGAFAGLIGGLIGTAEAAKAAREAMKDYRLSMEAMEASMRGDQVAEGAARIKAEMDGLRDMLKAGSGGGFKGQLVDVSMEQYLKGLITEAELRRRVALIGTEYGEEVLHILDVERERIAIMKETIELAKTHAREDLAVRELRAKGQDKEADALALKLNQEREYEAAVKAGMDEAYLATLRYVQGLEATRAATDSLNASMLGLPAGFKLAEYRFRALAALDNSPAVASGVTTEPRAGKRGAQQLPPIVIELALDGDTVATKVLTIFEGRAEVRNGDRATWPSLSSGH